MKTITDEQYEIYEEALAVYENNENFENIVDQITLSQDPEFVQGGVGDIVTLKEVKLPKEGGVLSYYNEYEYPRKGFPVSKVVEKVGVVKKVLISVLFSLLKSKLVLVIAILFFRKDLIKAYGELIDRLRPIIQFHTLKPFRYCKSVRELYVAFDKEDEALRDIVCMIFEFDDAYRYRMQDILGEFNKESFAKNPYMELERLLKLVEYRDNDDRLKTTFRKARHGLFIAFFSGYFREKIISFFEKINPKNMALDSDDLFFAKSKVVGTYGYKWGESPVS